MNFIKRFWIERRTKDRVKSFKKGKSFVTAGIKSFSLTDKLILFFWDINQKINIKILSNIRFWSYYKIEKVKIFRKYDFLNELADLLSIKLLKL